MKLKQFVILDRKGCLEFMGDTKDCAEYFNESIKDFTNAAWYAKNHNIMHKGRIIKEYKREGKED